MTRINIEIPDEIHKKIKIACAIKGTTIKDYIIDIINMKVNDKHNKNEKSLKNQ
ncbi:MAG: plasmid partition protein ParG [Candidatus Woesearchaeota archaeon]